MFWQPLMLPLDKAQLNLLQLIFFKDREMKKGKEHMSSRFCRRLGKKGQEEKSNKIRFFPSHFPEHPPSPRII